MKDGINFIHFEWTKVSEMKPRANLMLKRAPFPTNYCTIKLFTAVIVALALS